MAYKTILGTIAVVLAIASYVPYFRDIYLNKTKPHAYSWLVWGILISIGFAGQVVDGGGAGTWVTGATAFFCLVIFVAALFRGEKDITFSDKLSLGGAGVSLLLWYLTENPLGSIILVIIINFFGFYPTYRKSYYKPYEETLSHYAISVIKYIVGLIALEHYSLLTVLFPTSLLLMTTMLMVRLIRRRAQSTR